MTAATRGQPDRGDKTAGRRGASRDTPDDTRQPRNTRQEQERRTSGGKEGTRRSTAADREQGEIRQTEVKKRDINI